MEHRTAPRRKYPHIFKRAKTIYHSWKNSLLLLKFLNALSILLPKRSSGLDKLNIQFFSRRHFTAIGHMGMIDQLDALLCPPSFIQRRLEPVAEIGAGAPVKQWASGGAYPTRGAGRPLR